MAARPGGGATRTLLPWERALARLVPGSPACEAGNFLLLNQLVLGRVGLRPHAVFDIIIIIIIIVIVILLIIINIIIIITIIMLMSFNTSKEVAV